ncbi:SNF2 family N-terminal domain-containing protein [Halteromyces radiatus]|uniref:SNF2 family N-terminal domain-containing protein n=1 Tax=Halteromyces radiatus TaxID=101107 RepID=UPI00221FBDA2|nr:SNF2 family N-terminal domain-containing protein [Halteromyces radiatus]KAI8078854.1 SNF2 family N-terminal domain-containing protein [Halteromyces radiatus]
MQQRQKSVAQLRPTPQSTLDKIRNQAIRERELELQTCLARHDTLVREWAHLEVYQSIVDYDPTSFNTDERVTKFILDYNLWNLANDYLIKKHKQDRPVRTRHLQPNPVNSIRSGTGIRRFNRQYPSLESYLATFMFLDDIEDAKDQEQINALVAKERTIRQRIRQLEESGGFTTQWKEMASRRPQFIDHHHHRRDPSCSPVYESLVSQAITASKNFSAHSRYRRNAARKCAKAVDKYWENIRTREERSQREETKRLMKLAKWTVQQVRSKWRVVERICEARHKEILKEQQAKKSRRHLEMILEHSEQMLGVRMDELTASSSPIQQQNDWSDDNSSDHSPMAYDDVLDERDHYIDDDDDDDSEEIINEDDHLTVEQLAQKYQSLYTIDNQQKELEDSDYSNDQQAENDDFIISDDTESEDEINEDDHLTPEQLAQKYRSLQQPLTPDTTKEYDLTDNSEEDTGDNIISDDEVEDDDQVLLSLTTEAELPLDKLHARLYPSTSDDLQPTDVQQPLSSSCHIQPKVEYQNSHEYTTQPEIKATTTTTTTTNTESMTTVTETTTTTAHQPTGTTLSTTKVDTPIPFLLRGTLREYQHVGLDWLASLYNNGLNGILADEMGLGKTIQTIALLASLACEKGIWGPHLVVVPTSVILNWEMEFKRWLPGFKILTYYGNPKERKEKRSGWSKENAFHVCITSYQLVLQDQSAFRRKQWQYLILDEAHHIKNFRSQRWQVLLNFNSKRRLLLTGTPLQNNLMELWSLLYFLMPNGISASMPIGFANLKEFQEWFSSPVDRMIENQQGMTEESRNAIQKLHTVLRPYLLRRLKSDVEQQMPAKYEHIMYCRLSKRQRYLYDDFMGRAKTKETLASGNFLSIINTLMQLRKVCNHPDLFEERPIVTSFSMTDEILQQGERLEQWTRRRFKDDDAVNLDPLNLVIVRPQLEMTMSRWMANEYDCLDCSPALLDLIIQQRNNNSGHLHSRGITSMNKYLDLKTYAKIQAMHEHVAITERWKSIHDINQQRCQQQPLLGIGLLDLCRQLYAQPYSCLYFDQTSDVMSHCVLGYEARIQQFMGVIERYTFVTPAAIVKQPHYYVKTTTTTYRDIFHPLTSRLQIGFPDKRLLQYDCGKLQRLASLLQELAAGGHRALIFTQMTRVLDVLEAFLNMHGYRYLRLDGATKVEQRQLLTEQFNSDKRILCFILSTRSGGLGINLTGADTVIFYDSDWNPSMDKQCQDRAHRIGQLRDVHIYRFVTEFTIEENIFKKANQKRLLDDMVIQEGGFTNDYFQKMDWWKDLPEVAGNTTTTTTSISNTDMEQALLEAEGEKMDAQAAMAARNEMTLDDEEFEESTRPTPIISPSESSHAQSSPVLHPSIQEEDVELDLEVGHVDQYMLRFWEREMFGQYLGFGGLPEPIDF